MKYARLLPALFPLALVATLAAQIQLNSGPSTPIPGMSGMVVGDFNHDGKLDAAVVSANGKYLTVELGRGNGLFQTGFQEKISTGSSATLVSGDFNNDGNLDVIAYGASNSSQLSIFFGNADGTFQGEVSLPVPFTVGQAFMGNLNGDVYPDLVVIDGSASTLYPLLGTGTGAFTIGAAINFSGSPVCGQVAFADFNGDGKTDLAVNCLGVQVLYGVGNGTFGPPQTVATGRVIGVFAGDFNGDGRPDLLEETIPNGSVVGGVLINNGAGGFTAGQQISGFNNILRVADANGDGNLDLLGSSALGLGTEVSFGRGDGSFQMPVTFGVNETGNVFTGDANNDGKADLIVQQGGSIYVLPGLGNSTFVQPKQLSVSPKPLYQAEYSVVSAGDFNQDGLDDLIVTARGETGTTLQISSALNDGGGSFTIKSLLKTADVSAIAAVGDLNGDGKLDVILFGTTLSGGYIATLLGNGDGTFQTAQVVASVPESIGSYTLADFNGDGNLDVSVLFSASGDQGQYVATATYFGQGNGTFSGATYNALLSGSITSAVNLVSGDLNGDGKPDLAAVDLTHLSVLVNSGNSTFKGVKTTVGRVAYVGLAASDFNGDGLADLADISNPSPDSTGIATVLINQGDGTFASASYAAGLPSYLVAADLNRDGHKDIIVGSNESLDLTVLTNQGDGTFISSGAWVGATLDANLLIGHFLSTNSEDLVSGYSLFSVVP